MNILIGLILITFAATVSFADSVSNDFSTHTSDAKKKYLSKEDLRKQLELTGKIYVTSLGGEKLYFEGPEERKWKFGRTGDLISYWSFQSDKIGKFFLGQTWKINSDGKLQVSIQQYDSMVRNRKGGKKPKLGKVLKEKKFNLKDFSPVTWEVSKNSEQKVVVRITPSLIPVKKPSQISVLPISAKGIMAADNKGKLWIQNASFKGGYVALTTFNGTVYLSYQPFKGSAEIGFVEDSRMKITLGPKHSLNVLSSTPFLPNGIKAKIFGKINLHKKSPSYKSLHIQSSDKEKEFLNAINK